MPHYTDWQSAILGVSWSFLGIALVFLALRIFTRVEILPSSLGWDDWMIMLAAGLSIASSILLTMMVHTDLDLQGRHWTVITSLTRAMLVHVSLHHGRYVQYVDLKYYPTINSFGLIRVIIELLGIMFVKISVCVFLLRLVSRTNRVRRIVKWLITIDLMIGIPVTLVVCAIFIVQVVSVRYPSDFGRRRFSPKTIADLYRVVSATMGVSTDFMTAAIPIVVIYGLKMSRAQKFQIYGVLSLGFLVGGVCIAKTVLLKWSPEDETWNGSFPIFLSNIEFNGGIIVACAPVIKPAFQRIHRQLSSRLRSRSHPTHASQENGMTDCMTVGSRLTSASAGQVSGPPRLTLCESPGQGNDDRIWEDGRWTELF